jgi:tRNA pseudouridine55 synthase
MDGVFVIDKPGGMTSHDVVDAVRKRLRTRKVGHAGTLDPDATGLLLVGVGRATRFLSYAQDGPKRYIARARFGITTLTQDASGEVIEERDAPITRDEVAAELKRFVGTIEQIPPMVSAVKVGGERLYKKARRGEEIERPARVISVYELELKEFFEGERPEAELDVRCSAGTFVRTLIHDLGIALGCGAHMAELRRIEAGGFGEADAIAIEAVSRESMRPLIDAVTALPKIELDEEQTSFVRHGRPLALETDEPDGTPIALVQADRLLAVYKPKGGALVPDRVLSS